MRRWESLRRSDRPGTLRRVIVVLVGVGLFWIDSALVPARPAVATASTFGTPVVGTDTSAMSANTKRVNRYVLSKTAVVSKLTTYLQPSGATGTQSLKGLIYADSAGSPGALVAVSNPITLSNTSASGWYDLAFGTAVPLSAGAYWIGTLSGDTGGVLDFRFNEVANSRRYNSNPYTNGPSNPFGPATADLAEMSLYATYTVPASPTPTPTPAPNGISITNMPCTVTLAGAAQTGTCSGTFYPNTSTPTPTPTARPTATATPTQTATAGATPTPSPGTIPNPGNGVSTDPDFFPIGVWYQGVYSVSQYKAAGVNLFYSPSAYSPSQLATLASAGMAVAECSVNGQFTGSYLGADGNTYPIYSPSTCPYDGRSDPNANIIKAWFDQPDEPDLAQAISSSNWGPCVSPSYIAKETAKVVAGDTLSPKRPVMMDFNDPGVPESGRGSYCHDAASNYYPGYMQGAGIATDDAYPVNYGYPLDQPAVDVAFLHTSFINAGHDHPVYPAMETTPIHTGAPAPTPAQLHFEIWSSIVAGANGITYFCHIISPSFIEAGCLTLSNITAQMTSDDALIKSLAPVLNSNSLTSGVKASASFKVDVMTKSYGGSYYAFTDADNGSGGTATLAVPGGGSGTVTVVGEGRTLSMNNGSFTDSFAGYGVHIYRIP